MRVKGSLSLGSILEVGHRIWVWMNGLQTGTSPELEGHTIDTLKRLKLEVVAHGPSRYFLRGKWIRGRE